MTEPNPATEWYKHAWRWCVAHPYLLIGFVVVLLFLLVLAGHLVYPRHIACGRGSSLDLGSRSFVAVNRVKYFVLLSCATIAGLITLSRQRSGKD